MKDICTVARGGRARTSRTARTARVSLAALALASGSIACAEPEAGLQEEEVLAETVTQPIVNGAPATEYLEAALINGPGFICSGAIIAPRVVLTAGHCVVGTSSWTVVAPYAGKQSAKGSRSWTEYTSTGDFVNAKTNDVAVIILDKAITLAKYPTLASAPSPAGTKAVNVGRIRNGVASSTGLFFGATVTLKAGTAFGFPKSYVSEEIIESGDSGGPVYVASGASRAIAAVNSGGGGGTQVLARVDLAYATIQQLIADNGGSGAAPPPATTPPPVTPPPPVTTPPPATCTGTPEVEPNDTSNAPNALSGTRCGALTTGSDIDWYSWSLASAGVAYEVALQATGDADVLMWKRAGSSWSPIANTSRTRIAATSSSAGQYLVAVRSQAGAAQTYGVALTR